MFKAYYNILNNCNTYIRKWYKPNITTSPIVGYYI